MNMMEATKTVVCKLRATEEEAEKIRETAIAFRDACNYISEIAFTQRCFNPVALHHFTYRTVRERYKLPANLAVRARDRVAKSYKQNRHRQHKFRQLSMDLDKKLFTLLRNNGEFRISIATLHGRVKLALDIGDYQRQLLNNPVQDAKITFRNGDIYAHIAVRYEIPDPEGSNYVGVDIGERNIIVASNGFKRKGGDIKARREHYREQRRALQKIGTSSAKRKLKRLSGREKRWANTVLHQISREFVDSLKEGDVVVLEDLTGIRDHIKRRKKDRAGFHSWAFRKLTAMIEYKCLERGIPVIRVDPAYTSQQCPRCDVIDRRNRRTQALFRCVNCGFQDNADHVASVNLSELGAGSHSRGCCQPA
ncbi:MAG: transposase [Methanophagales archaeon]|nr:transposase [Methanophagales archaeon]